MQQLIEVDGLFDGTRTLANAAIVLEDGAIAWIGRQSRIPRAHAAARAVRAPAPFVIPGLVNCHAHLSLDGNVDFSGDARLPEATQTLRAFRNARAALRAGVTTMRDLGAGGTHVIQLAQAIESGALEGPRLIACGRGVTSTGGHGFEIGRMADGPDEVRKAAREQLMAGASVIKIFSTGGVLGAGAGPEIAQFTTEETAAAVDEARKAGVRATAHAHGAAGMRTAIAAGIDSIEHATMLDAATVRLLRERDVPIVPTLSAIAAVLGRPKAFPEPILARARAVAERHQESVHMAHRAGVRIAAGTDAGSPFNYHDRFVEELLLLAEAGLSREEALVAATRIAGDVIGLPRAGRLGPGCWADLVFVDGDPLSDLGVLDSPRGVWVRGSPVQR